MGIWRLAFSLHIYYYRLYIYRTKTEFKILLKLDSKLYKNLNRLKAEAVILHSFEAFTISTLDVVHFYLHAQTVLPSRE